MGTTRLQMTLGLGACLAIAGAIALSLVMGGPPEVETRTFLSDSLKITGIHRSMRGPSAVRSISLVEGEGDREIVWLRGLEIELLDHEGDTAPPELMCHMNLDIANVAGYRDDFALPVTPTGRIATLSQGQLALELPEGTGIPVWSDEALNVASMVLNLNETSLRASIRQKLTVRFVRESRRRSELKALFPTSAYGLAAADDRPGHWGVSAPDPEVHGAGCLVADAAEGAALIGDGTGRQFTGHWVVPPGRQVNKTLVTRLMNLPYDTTLHYMAVHLHPLARSLVLRDLTSGDTIYVANAENRDEGLGLVRVDHFSSAEGVPLYKDHEYEVESVYENPTGEDQDAMAVFYMFVANKSWKGWKGSDPNHEQDPVVSLR